MYPGNVNYHIGSGIIIFCRLFATYRIHLFLYRSAHYLSNQSGKFLLYHLSNLAEGG